MPLTNNDVIDTLAPVASVLDSLNISFYLGGSIAGIAHGITRQPNDIDLSAEIKYSHISSFTQRLQQNYYIGNINDAITQNKSFNLISFATSEKIDIYPMNNSLFERDCLNRAKIYTLRANSSLTCKVESAEGVILHKLRWATNSSYQMSDVVEIMKASASILDWNYLDQVAATLGITAQLNLAIQNATA
jgi:hypothetical protein